MTQSSRDSQRKEMMAPEQVSSNLMQADPCIHQHFQLFLCGRVCPLYCTNYQLVVESYKTIVSCDRYLEVVTSVI